MSAINTRHHQMYPVLGGQALRERWRPPLQSRGSAVRCRAARCPSLAGSVDISRRDGLNHEEATFTLGAGQMIGEVSQLAGRGMLAAGRAGPEGCIALPFDAPHLRPWSSARPRSAAF